MEIPNPHYQKCTVCSKPANTLCAGCADALDITGNHLAPTRYCGTTCQAFDKLSHKNSCQAAQAGIKLFRAGRLLKECFLAIREEAFDLFIVGVKHSQDGTIHLFDEPADKVRSLLRTLANDTKTKDAVLSLGAGRDVFSGIMFELCNRALEGAWSSHIPR